MATKIGAVETSSTAIATDVISIDVIQVAKWIARKNAGEERRAGPS